MIKEELRDKYHDKIVDILIQNHYCLLSDDEAIDLIIDIVHDNQNDNHETNSGTNKDINKYKSLFITYFDGGYEIDPIPNVPTTYQMGICNLEYNIQTNTLNVYLRRPGLLIGRKGETLNKLNEYLDCNINIIEVTL